MKQASIQSYNIEVTNPNNIGIRIDKYLGENVKELSRTRIAKLFDKNLITVNNKVINKKYKLKLYDKIYIQIPPLAPCSIDPENINLDIVYEDNDLLIVNKAKGMIVHPANNIYTGTLVNALLYHCKDTLSGINGIIRPGIVHRIDKDTSGLIIIAKNDNAHIHLAKQIKEHSFKRVYNAIVYGNFNDMHDVINLPIGRSALDRKKMAVTYKNSKQAITKYNVIKNLHNFSHLELTLETGRTHQIRVHMSYCGHPVAGDSVYGPKKVIKSLNGQCLHAKTIGFIHPTNKKYIEFDSQLPNYFIDFLNYCEREK